MDTFFRFLYELLSQFFDGFITIFKGLALGVVQMFNIPEYIKIINFYKDDFNGGEWVLVFISVMVILIIIGGIIVLLYFLIRKYLRCRTRVSFRRSVYA